MSQETTLFPTGLNWTGVKSPGQALGTRRYHPNDQEPKDGYSVNSLYSMAGGFVYGPRVFRLVKNGTSSIIAKGSIIQIYADTSDVGDATSSSTKQTIFLDATDRVKFVTGDLIAFEGVDGAPHGQVRVVKAVTGNGLLLNYPMDQSPSSSDDVRAIRPWRIKALTADNHYMVGMTLGAVPAGGYGWVQTWGIHLQVPTVNGNAIAIGAALYAAAGALTDAVETNYAPVGWAMSSVRSGSAADVVVAFLTGDR